MLSKFRDQVSSKNEKLKTVYNVIRKFSPINVETLMEKTGYKPATCARLIDELVKNNLISSSGYGESTGGRKPMMYQINPTSSYLIGVEITSLYTTVLLLDLQLRILDIEKIKMNNTYTTFQTLDLVLERINILFRKHKISEKDLLGIGVAVVDFFDQLNNVDNKQASQQIMKQSEIEMKEYISSRFHTCVLLDKGVNFAALAEYRSNYWKSANHLLFTSCDIEIHSSYILDGNLVLDNREMTDFFGHMVVDINGKRCSCGSFGCLHTFSSLSAIKNEIVQRLKRGKKSQILGDFEYVDSIDFHHILNAIEQNDPLCTSVVEEAAYYYGIGLSNLIFTLKPEIVICGGTLVPKSVFFDVARETALKRLKVYPNLQVQIIAASTSYNTVAQGAGCMVLEHYLQ
jgi:predicted NBD/HSP70 family sugar kinase